LAAKQIKYILKSNRHNVFHKRLQYSINTMKKIMENNDLALVKAESNAQHHKGHHVHLLHVLLLQHRDWSSGF